MGTFTPVTTLMVPKSSARANCCATLHGVAPKTSVSTNSGSFKAVTIARSRLAMSSGAMSAGTSSASSRRAQSGKVCVATALRAEAKGACATINMAVMVQTLSAVWVHQ
jgi:hypothetical protein